MGDIINNIVTDKQDIKNQIGTLPDSLPVVKRFNNTLRLRRLFAKQFFLDPVDSFVLGSATNGVLGTNMLGDRRVEVSSRVFPHNNVVEEDFVDDTFIDTDVSTGSINTSNETFSLSSGQILQSKVVCKIGTPINNIKFSSLIGGVVGTDFDLYVSVDSGATFRQIDYDKVVNFTNGGENDALVYKIIAINTVTLESPLKIQVNKA